jgi:hypothetical protein
MSKKKKDPPPPCPHDEGLYESVITRPPSDVRLVACCKKCHDIVSTLGT